MGYQFVHVESYGRKAGKGKSGGNTVGSVLAEADRREGYCPHVEQPAKPGWLIGSAEVVARAVTEYAKHTKDPTGRRLRADGLCMVGGVVSAPDDLDDQGWQQMKRDSLAFLRDSYGERLRGAVEHTDESKRHFHYYLVPKPGERFAAVHEGKRAAEAEARAGQPKGEQNKAYVSAMRAWQDTWHDQVMAPAGLTRMGPGKRRLTRAEWKAEQAQAKTLAGELRDVRRQRRELERMGEGMQAQHQARLDELKQLEQQLKSERQADRSMSNATRAAKAVQDAERARAEAEQAKAEARAAGEALEALKASMAAKNRSGLRM